MKKSLNTDDLIVHGYSSLRFCGHSVLKFWTRDDVVSSARTFSWAGVSANRIQLNVLLVTLTGWNVKICRTEVWLKQEQQNGCWFSFHYFKSLWMKNDTGDKSTSQNSVNSSYVSMLDKAVKCTVSYYILQVPTRVKNIPWELQHVWKSPLTFRHQPNCHGTCHSTIRRAASEVGLRAISTQVSSKVVYSPNSSGSLADKFQSSLWRWFAGQQ